MKPQDPSSRASRRQWLIAGGALAAAAVLAFFLAKSDTPHVAEVALESPDQPGKLAPPRLNPTALQREAPPAEAQSADKVVSCRECQEKNRGGLCQRDMGCDGLSGEDRTLCENLLSCLKAHPDCYMNNPVHCYCGTATGLDCVKHPQGECVKEAQAATKTTDLTQAAVRFYRPDFPSGRATQVAACNMRACKDACAEARL
jgi:hypothetical protein